MKLFFCIQITKFLKLFFAQAIRDEKNLDNKFDRTQTNIL